MKKDVIYIDVDDDITTIVGKIKSAKERIVALVPPKRIGVLQSAVTMRLLTRAAGDVDKRLVLITGDSALAGLAAAARIPVAKNLQTKPEVAEVPALKVDGDDDIIDGRELVDPAPAADADRPKSAPATSATPSASDKKPATPAKKNTPKVPNFNLFRKKMLLIGGGVLALLIFLIWAIWFAPRATVVITAKTTSLSINNNVALKLEGATDTQSRVIKALYQEQKHDVSVDFTPTGKKRVGEKASGTMRLSRTSISSTPISVPAGTAFSAGDYTFVSTESATLSGTSVGPGGLVQSGASVKVVATKIGDEYNLSERRYQSSIDGISAQGTNMSGGSSRDVTVVSSEDVAKASERLKEQKDTSAQAKLSSSFGSSAVVIKESYAEQLRGMTPSVAVDNEANGPVTLKATRLASMFAVDKTELKKYLVGSVENELKGKKSQKIYKDGVNDTKFSQFAESGGNYTVNLATKASVGPTIDETKVKDQAKGRSYGDIQSSLESIDGVEDVDTKFWPFWVHKVPNDTKRINVEFKLKNAS